MKMLTVFICVCVAFLLVGLRVAQAQPYETKVDREALVQALSGHGEFQDIYHQNLRFIELKEAGVLTPDEEKVLH